MSELAVSDGTHSTGTRVLWGDEGPAYARGWRDHALFLAADLEIEADGLVAPAAKLARRIAEMCRQHAQDGPGAIPAPQPVSVATPDRTEALRAADDMDPLFDLPPEGSTK